MDAVAAYRSALEVRTKADLPQDWDRDRGQPGQCALAAGRSERRSQSQRGAGPSGSRFPASACISCLRDWSVRALWNPGQQSQKTCSRSSARDLQVPRPYPGAATAGRYRKTDVLSTVRKSRSSSGGLYRCRRHSAHDRYRANAMRFFMKTLRARPTSRSIPAFRQNLLVDTLGLRCCLRLAPKPGSGHQGATCAPHFQAPHLWHESNPASQSCCYANLEPLLCCYYQRRVQVSRATAAPSTRFKSPDKNSHSARCDGSCVAYVRERLRYVAATKLPT